jgi:hypothetical protein
MATEGAGIPAGVEGDVVFSIFDAPAHASVAWISTNSSSVTSNGMFVLLLPA